MNTTIVGTSSALTQWFLQPVHLNKAVMDECMREEFLSDLYHATAVAVAGEECLVVTSQARCLIRVNHADKVVHFDYAPKAQHVLYSFWFNASSVKDLSTRLRTVPRRPMDTLLINA